ncbi:RagB/SusD family nutrient uptake outer membrane protein [Bacteroides thetaiotaomicron]|uniref:RagB/SusD family nutrient uptake outer membrane protein n=1 Tax=Bacteroides thetaiotaomicron TaxID=818 RepID=UPI00216548BC|nr:RagB/SusD family nutrient uptake outer membrane protein [Bacteroides thetaiotaomicron]MCS2872156.1 RagB/SusD family nutrient uptake outer membrane protein [Bacteroides thetaiotaomicron]
MSGNVLKRTWDDAKAQARFVRAYIYYKLIERYGPVPIMPEEGLDVEKPYDELGTPRTAWTNASTSCAMNCLRAAASLPETRNKSNRIRATKGLALSIRAKILILAASPLFNSEDTLFII